MEKLTEDILLNLCAEKFIASDGFMIDYEINNVTIHSTSSKPDVFYIDEGNLVFTIDTVQDLKDIFRIIKKELNKNGKKTNSM